jgi:alkylation response protein AidB-like acyl-CoA dehydrogenase
MDVHGAASMTAGTGPADTGPGDSADELRAWQKLYLFSRAETIYGGSDEIQHNIIATHALGLPRPPRR